MKNFWQQLETPFYVLAPMEDVTDTVLRQMVANIAAPDVFFTEFASTDGYAHELGRPSTMERLRLDDTHDTPIVAQIWGTNPEHFEAMARDVSTMGFAGIDINMGCPAKKITKNGACSALIDTPELAIEIIQATKRGAGDLPVSVKTRLGVRKIETERWITQVLEQDIAALTVHARTAREMSKVPAHWEEFAKVVELRDKLAPQTLIIGNGDILTRSLGAELATQYGIDGIMIGRGLFQDINVFNDGDTELSIGQRLDYLNQHVDLFEQTWGKNKNFESLKKFFKVYVTGCPGAAELRTSLMNIKELSEAKTIVATWREQNLAT